MFTITITNLVRSGVATHQVIVSLLFERSAKRKTDAFALQIMEASGHRCEASMPRYNHSSDNQRLAVAQLAVQTGKEGLHEVQQRVVLSQQNVNTVNVNLPVQPPRKKQRSNAFPFNLDGMFQGANMSGSVINFNFGDLPTFPSSTENTFPVRPLGVREAEFDGEEEEEEEPLVRFR